MGWLARCAAAALCLGLAGCDYVPDYIRALFVDPAVITKKNYKNGEFKGDLDVRFLSTVSGDGQRVEMIQLLQPFGYKDSKGRDWDVPAGFLSDGASIPRQLWLMLGGPFSGPYRDAAVIHDFFCWTKDRPWEDVHEVFAEAAARRGTSEQLAKVMYAGILFGGPRWQLSRSGAGQSFRPIVRAQLVPAPATPVPATPVPAAKSKTDKEVFDDLKAWIENEKPTLDQIRKRVDELRKAQVKPAPK